MRLPLNRGQGAALRTGYRLALITGADVVVTMDADGQHQPSELSRLVAPIVADEADVVNGSRVLGDADPSHAAREMGIKLFAQLLSLLTWSKITDPACGYRAVRTEALRGLEFRQDQFHNSEFIIEASKTEAAHDRGAGDGRPAALGHVQEACALPLRDGLCQRAGASVAQVARGPVVHWDDVTPRTREVGYIKADWSYLGSKAGSVTVGVNRLQIPPGRMPNPPHLHGAEEEIFYVLSGSGLSWQDGRDVRGAGR